MGDFGSWYNSIPQFTKYWFSATVALSLIAELGILPIQYLYLDFTFVFWNFHLWRPVTALFCYRPSLHFLMNLYFLYSYSSRIENDQFKQTPADYLYLLMFNWICSVLVGFFFGFPFLMDVMVLSVLYIWCQLNKELTVSFWFGTRFKAMYLPWVLAVFNWIVNKDIFTSILGIAIGHLYFFLKYQYPQELGGNSFLETPRFLKSYFPDLSVTTGFGFTPLNRRPTEANPPPAGNRLFADSWGRGNALGHD